MPKALPSDMETLVNRYRSLEMDKYDGKYDRSRWPTSSAMMWQKYHYLYTKVKEKAEDPSFAPDIPMEHNAQLRMSKAARFYDEMRKSHRTKRAFGANAL